MKMRIAIVSLLLVITICQADGQVIQISNQYLLNPLAINPAYAGLRGSLNLATMYRHQWVGIKDAPSNLTLVSDIALFGDKVGAGLSISNERYGITNQTRLASSYAYRIKMGLSTMAMGLGVAGNFTKSRNSELVAIDPGDEIYLSDNKVHFIPDFSLGFYYTYRSLFVGFSLPQFVTYNYSLSQKTNIMLNDPARYAYLLNFGNTFTVNSYMKLQPSALMIYNKTGGFQFDINCLINVLDRFGGGISYRNQRSLSGLLQFQFNNQFRMAYLYDFDLGKINRFSNGSHEIMIGYEFRYKADVTNPINF
jgi:type IX secretion system PorP/SprF family membrane protein